MGKIMGKIIVFFWGTKTCPRGTFLILQKKYIFLISVQNMNITNYISVQNMNITNMIY